MSDVRTTRRTVTFTRPFTLGPLTEAQPPGDYEVETEEALLPTFTASAWRRTATHISLPAHPGSGGLAHVLEIDPQELERALAADVRPVA